MGTCCTVPTFCPAPCTVIVEHIRQPVLPTVDIAFVLHTHVNAIFLPIRNASPNGAVCYRLAYHRHHLRRTEPVWSR